MYILSEEYAILIIFEGFHSDYLLSLNLKWNKLLEIFFILLMKISILVYESKAGFFFLLFFPEWNIFSDIISYIESQDNDILPMSDEILYHSKCSYTTYLVIVIYLTIRQIFS